MTSSFETRTRFSFLSVCPSLLEAFGIRTRVRRQNQDMTHRLHSQTRMEGAGGRGRVRGMHPPRAHSNTSQEIMNEDESRRSEDTDVPPAKQNVGTGRRRVRYADAYYADAVPMDPP
jgi:hypothetical protein